MKTTFLILAFIMAGYTVFSQENTTVKFTISNTNDITVAVNDKDVDVNNKIDVPVKKNGTLNFKVVADKSKKYDLQLTLGSKFKKKYSQVDFLGDKSISTDNNLKIDDFILENKSPDVKILIGGKLAFAGTLAIKREVEEGEGNADGNGNGGGNPNPDKKKPEDKAYVPGSIYYDVFALLTPEKVTEKEWDNIVRFYFDSKSTLHQDLINLIADKSKNKFLAISIDTNKINSSSNFKKVTKDLGAQSSIPDLSSLSFSSIGGLDVTNIADGIAKFLVKRAKQELSTAFFQKFKKIIDSTKDLHTIFPQTASLLSSIDDEIYDYERYIQNLREAFKEDIASIHHNLPGITENHPAFFTKHQELKTSLLSACYIAQELDDQAHPGDILANYPVELLDSLDNKNYKGAIQTLQLISESLRDTASGDEGDYWVNIKQVRQLVNDRKTLGVYLGLLYQTLVKRQALNDNINYEGTNLKDILDLVADKYDAGFTIYDSYKRYVLKFGEKVEALNKMIKEYGQPTSDSAIIEKYAKYFRASVDMIEYCSKVSTLPIIDKYTPNLTLLLDKYFDISYAATDMVIDINRKNYSSAINHAVHIYNVVRVKAQKESLVAATNSFDEADKKKDPARTKEIIDKEKDQLTLLKKESTASKTSLNMLVKYGSFMATVATAKNSNDVEKAIETAALPAGSSKLKRTSCFNVSLNAYAGLFYGIERINGVDSGKSNPNVYGVAAPIGVAASWGHTLFFIPTGKYEWSTSVFVSLIDLGAIASFRFKDDSTAQVPTIQLKDIISPGAFLSIGIPKCPLSLNLGAQMGPNLRKINTSDPAKLSNDYSNKTYWRFSASICVDIPLMNFYTKSRE